MRVFAGILVAIVTHFRRITHMPDPTLTLYCCISWCTHIYCNTTVSVGMLAGILVAIVRHVRRITYTPKITRTLCYSVLFVRYMLIKLTHGAHRGNIKCSAPREILATLIVTHVTGKQTQANLNIIILC